MSIKGEAGSGAKKKSRKILALVSALFACVNFFGCATHSEETSKIRGMWAAGGAGAALPEVSEKAFEKSDTADALVWYLEAGAVARASGDLEASIDFFRRAHAKFEEFEEQSDADLVAEAKALLADQSFIPYKGGHCDRIMTCVYQAMNFMEKGDFDSALVEINRLQNYQRNAEAENLGRIERERAAIEEAGREDGKGDYGVSKTLASSGVAEKLRSIYGDDYNPKISLMQAKSLYVNPFAYWFGGIFLMNVSQDISEKNMASDLLRFAAESVEHSDMKNTFFADAKVAEDFANGKISRPFNYTYLIYETGTAPVIAQRSLNLPLYIIKGNIPHVSVNFPYLEYQNSFASNLVLSDGALLKSKTELAADMDKIMRGEFNARLPLAITRMIASAAAKAAIQYAMVSASGDGNNWGGLLINIGMSIYQSATNKADCRIWTTLPKQIKVARIKTPPDGKVYLDGKLVEVSPDGSNIIFVKRMGANSQTILRKFNFTKK